MQFPHIDPVFLSIGPLQFRWYGLMYVMTFVAAYFIIISESARKKLPLTKDNIADLIFYGAMGVVLGGRFGYILFYNLGFYLANPLKLFAVWEGGMSFHGGFLGVMLAFWLYARRMKIPYLSLIDMAALCAPVGLGMGRIGNFINGELYGRPTDVAWGMIFPGSDGVPRHPSQLYEAFLEGIVLFFIVYIVSRSSKVSGVTTCAAIAGYGMFRFIVEFYRQPDAHIGLFFGLFSEGQLLSLPMFIIGIAVAVLLTRHQRVQ